MRPDKPGNWWWEDTTGDVHVVEFYQITVLSSIKLCDAESLSAIWDIWEEGVIGPGTLKDFENRSDFGRWLGPAHPTTGCVLSSEKEMDRLRRVEAKAMIRLQDRIDDGCGGDFCPFCQRTFDHAPECIYWDIPVISDPSNHAED